MKYKKNSLALVLATLFSCSSTASFTRDAYLDDPVERQGISMGLERGAYLTRLGGWVAEQQQINNTTTSDRAALFMDATYMFSNITEEIRTQIGLGAGFSADVDLRTESIDAVITSIDVPSLYFNTDFYMNLVARANITYVLVQANCQVGFDDKTCSVGVGVRY